MVSDPKFLVPLDNPERLAAVRRALDSAHARFKLPTDTRFVVQDIDVSSNGVFLTSDQKFQAVVTVYVGIGGKGTDFDLSDGLPAVVEGHFDDSGTAVLENAELDQEAIEAAI